VGNLTVLVAAPCAVDSANSLKQSPSTSRTAGGGMKSGVKMGACYAREMRNSDLQGWARCGRGVALLANLIHRNCSRWNGPAEAFVPLR